MNIWNAFHVHMHRECVHKGDKVASEPARPKPNRVCIQCVLCHIKEMYMYMVYKHIGNVYTGETELHQPQRTKQKLYRMCMYIYVVSRGSCVYVYSVHTHRKVYTWGIDLHQPQHKQQFKRYVWLCIELQRWCVSHMHTHKHTHTPHTQTHTHTHAHTHTHTHTWSAKELWYHCGCVGISALVDTRTWTTCEPYNLYVSPIIQIHRESWCERKREHPHGRESV